MSTQAVHIGYNNSDTQQREAEGAVAQDTSIHGPTAPDETPVLDSNVLTNLRRLDQVGEPGFLADLIRRFLADTPKRISAIRDAITAGDAHALHQTAHLLRGNTANLGARGLSALCRELDALGRTGTTAGALPHLQRIEAEFFRVRVALEAEALKPSPAET